MSIFRTGLFRAPALTTSANRAISDVIFCLTQRLVPTPGIEPGYYGGILQIAYGRGSAALPSPRMKCSQHWTRCLELGRLMCIYNALFSASATPWIRTRTHGFNSLWFKGTRCSPRTSAPNWLQGTGHLPWAKTAKCIYNALFSARPSARHRPCVSNPACAHTVSMVGVLTTHRHTSVRPLWA